MSKKKALGQKLAEIRQQHDTSIVTLSREIGCRQSTILKIESGKAMPTLDFVKKFTSALGLSEGAIQNLEQYTHNFLSEFDKWNTDNDNDLFRQPDDFDSTDALFVVEERESRASLIEAFQLSSVFALLQTPRYTQKILSLLGYNDTEYVDMILQARVKRQKALADRSKRFNFVMNESVLRCGAFSKDLIYEQLERFEELSKLPNVSIRFVPLGRMISIHSSTSFTMFDRELTVIEGACQEFKVWTELENKVYADLFDKVYREAVSLEYLLSMPSQKVYQPLSQFY